MEVFKQSELPIVTPSAWTTFPVSKTSLVDFIFSYPFAFFATLSCQCTTIIRRMSNQDTERQLFSLTLRIEEWSKETKNRTPAMKPKMLLLKPGVHVEAQCFKSPNEQTTECFQETRGNPRKLRSPLVSVRGSEESLKQSAHKHDWNSSRDSGKRSNAWRS